MKWFRSLSNKQLAVLALIIANFIWGAASPIFKWSLENIPLFVLAYLRFFIASLLFYPFAAKNSLHIETKDLPDLIGMAISGITINIIFFFLGLKLTSSINAPIIASAGPVFLLLASVILLKEKLQKRKIIGIIVSLFGILIILGRPLFEKGFDFSAILGNFYIIIATVGSIAHTLFCKKLTSKYPANTITFWIFVIGTFTFLPFFVYQSNHSLWLSQLDIRGIVGLIFGAVFSSTIAYGLFSWATSKIEASETGVFSYVDPVAATIIAIPLLGEVITPLFIIGATFVFLGIFIAENRLHYHPFYKLHKEVHFSLD